MADNEQVHNGDILGMIRRKVRHPGLAAHVCRPCIWRHRLHDLKPELEQFAVDT